MIQKVMFGLALFSSLLFSVPLPAQQRIPLEVLPSGHIVVKATVNGVEGRFIFDTGAGMNLLTKKFAQRVNGLTKQDGRFTAFRAIGDRLDVELYTAKSITLGTFVTNSTALTVYEGEIGGFDGLISLTAFKQQPFTLDLRNRQLVVETPASLAKRRQSGNGIPLLVGNAQGQTVDISAYFRVNDKLTLLFPLDSGAGKGVYRINSAFASQIGIDTAALAPANRIVRASEFAANNRNVIYRATLNKLTPQAIPGLQLTKAPVQLVNGLIYDGIIPLDWLGEQLTIDVPHQILLVN
jgi:hypothetical protein